MKKAIRLFQALDKEYECRSDCPYYKDFLYLVEAALLDKNFEACPIANADLIRFCRFHRFMSLLDVIQPQIVELEGKISGARVVGRLVELKALVRTSHYEASSVAEEYMAIEGETEVDWSSEAQTGSFLLEDGTVTNEVCARL